MVKRGQRQEQFKGKGKRKRAITITSSHRSSSSPLRWKLWKVAQVLIIMSGCGSLLWTHHLYRQFSQQHDPNSVDNHFLRDFSKKIPKKKVQDNFLVTQPQQRPQHPQPQNQTQSQPYALQQQAQRQDLLIPFHLQMPSISRIQRIQKERKPPVQSYQQSMSFIQHDKDPEPKAWTVPTALPLNGFDRAAFEERLNSWRRHRILQSQPEVQRQQQLNHHHREHDSLHSIIRITPYLHRAPLFPRRPLTWNFMVVVMADTNNNDPAVNATDRLLTTLEDVLNTQMAQVVAYLPHPYIGPQQQWYQAIRQRFWRALEIGQLHVVSSPLPKQQQQQQAKDAYRFARNGLEFAYAAELAHTYSDLCLFVQAGSRILPEWWRNRTAATHASSKEPSPSNTTTTTTTTTEMLTTNRDYVKEIVLAYEGRFRLAGDGASHDMCYMNFAKDVVEVDDDDNRKVYSQLENPTGVLFDSADLMRLSLMLRSFLPYGTFPVSTLLERYCSVLRWEADRSDAPLLLFQYTPKANETTLPYAADVQPIEDKAAATYPYLLLHPSEIPIWVTVNASMVGPQPVTTKNVFLQPNRKHYSDGDVRETYWITFVIPTAWRHTTKDAANATKGNAYVVECLRQLTSAIQKYFTGEHNAMILVLVSGNNQVDIRQHQQGLEAEFATEINSGMIKLVQAPLHQYPTLHGLDSHYEDPEHRVRWRSKQNLDISAAFFAAKGWGKYIMMIEDDSGFRPVSFLKGIKLILTNLHRTANPDDSMDFNPRVFRNNPVGIGGGIASNGSISIKYGDEKEEPALVEMGHREIWSQLRFAFGYSGIMVHDEDAYVYGILHSLLYQEKPCDMLFDIAKSIRTGVTKDHFLRWNSANRYITHLGKISTLKGKVFSDKDIVP